MAVSLTAAALRGALRLGDSAEETAEATRLLAYSTAAVTKHAPRAPDVVHNEAAIRLAGYLFDAPNAGRGAAFADTLRNSGALSVLAPYRTHRAGSTGATTTPAPAPAGLRQTGIEAVTVTAAGRWVSTGLPYPITPIFGAQVDPPTGVSTGVNLGLTADLLDAGAVVGGDASAAVVAQLYALAAASEGDLLLFASSTAGVYTVRMFEHAGS